MAARAICHTHLTVARREGPWHALRRPAPDMAKAIGDALYRKAIKLAVAVVAALIGIGQCFAVYCCGIDAGS